MASVQELSYGAWDVRRASAARGVRFPMSQQRDMGTRSKEAGRLFGIQGTGKNSLAYFSTWRNNTLRTMDNDSQLGFALLGLVHEQPQSGYDLRKVFASTAMGSFSDSPGAIYPALARLEKRGFVRGDVEESTSLRKRRVFRITPKGLAAFKAWLKKPVTRDDVIRRLGELMLRFAFMELVLGAGHAAGFLRQFSEELSSYIPSLEQFLEANGKKMPLSARLALECGVMEYDARLKWAKSSLAIYEQRKRDQS